MNIWLQVLWVQVTIWIVGILIILYLTFKFHEFTGVIRYVPNNRIGIVERLWSPSGSIRSGLIALGCEAGYLPDVVRGGWHVFWWPFQYRLRLANLVTVPLGTMGYVYARSGAPLPATQTLARSRPGEDFRDVRAFLEDCGQAGPQDRVLREGTYAINLVQFVVLTEDETHAVDLSAEDGKVVDEMRNTIEARQGFRPYLVEPSQNGDMIGLVTVHDGPPLADSDIVAPQVEGHQSFQDPSAFHAHNGRRGRQLEVLVNGTFFINRLFATIEPIPYSEVEIGNVGVVVAFFGQRGADLSGEEYGHGELVAQGHRGVWDKPLLPGKYAWNSAAGRITVVPTTNIVLKWEKGEVGGHRFDENLGEVDLITKDAFEPALPVSFVLHIDYRKAPLLIQRFGDVKRLVEQSLDPMVSAYFKNAAQTRTFIQLINDRAELQRDALTDMKAKLAEYSLELQEVLVGTPKPQPGDTTLEQILVQLRNRQIATEQIATYENQQRAAVKLRELNEAQATASMQQDLTQSAIRIHIADNDGSASLARTRRDAEGIKVTAEANANRMFVEGDAQARATKLQVEAYGGAEYQLARQVAESFFQMLSVSKVPVVPEVLVAGGEQQSGGIGDVLKGLLAATMVPRRDNAASPTMSLRRVGE